MFIKPCNNRELGLADLRAKSRRMWENRRKKKKQCIQQMLSERKILVKTLSNIDAVKRRRKNIAKRN